MTAITHYTAISERDIWFPDPGELSGWLRIDKRPPDLFYRKGDMVTYQGLVFISTKNYNCTSPVWPSPQIPRDWVPLRLVALPYRQGKRYTDGAVIFSTASGAVWIYDEPSEEWCLLLTMSKLRLAELRRQRMGKALQGARP